MLEDIELLENGSILKAPAVALFLPRQIVESADLVTS